MLSRASASYFIEIISVLLTSVLGFLGLFKPAITLKEVLEAGIVVGEGRQVGFEVPARPPCL